MRKKTLVGEVHFIVVLCVLFSFALVRYVKRDVLEFGCRLYKLITDFKHTFNGYVSDQKLTFSQFFKIYKKLASYEP